MQIPRSCQCLLMSATSSEEVERLQKLVLHNPTTLNLLGSDSDPNSAAGPGPGSAAEIDHYYVACDRHASVAMHALHFNCSAICSSGMRSNKQLSRCV